MAADDTVRKGRPLRVLLVEDDKLLADMLLDALLKGRVMATVTHCLDGEQALERLRRDRDAGQAPDVVILDVLMPRTDGIEVALTLRQEEQAAGLRPVPIVLMTAVSQTDTRLQSTFGFCQPAQYLHKSDFQDLAALVARVQEFVYSSVESITGRRQPPAPTS